MTRVRCLQAACLIASVAVGTGCSASTDRGPSDARAATGGTAGDAARGAASVIDGSSSEGAGGKGSDQAGAGGLGGSSGDDRLLPLEVGRRWTYQRTKGDPAGMDGCASPLEGTVTGQAKLGSDVGWAYHPVCETITVYMFMAGDEIWGYVSTALTARISYASIPVQEGFSWLSNTGSRFVWHDEGAVQVPAGRFDRCWRRAQVNDESSYIVLCRGVGLVVVNAPSDSYRLELAARNF